MSSCTSPERRTFSETKGLHHRRLSAAAIVVLFGWLAPRASLACSVCFGSTRSEVLQAFYLTAILLTVLPLLIAAATISYIVRRRGGAVTFERRGKLSSTSSDGRTPRARATP